MKKMMKKIFLLFVMLMICFATGMYSNAVRNCEKDGHFFVKAETIAPTCIKVGYTKYCCECGSYYRNLVAARGHNFEMTYSIMPTCTESGWVVFAKCLDCGEIIDEGFEVPPTNHDFEIVSVDKMYCDIDGVINKKCKVCSKILIEPAPAQPHSWGNDPDCDWVIVEKMTCTNDGLCRRTCKNCRAVEEKLIDASGHKYIITDIGIVPTCTTEGRTAIRTCVNCGDVIGSVTISAYGHLDADGDLICDRENCREKLALIEGVYTYTIKDNKAIIKSVDPSISGDIVIPSTLGGYPVTTIGDEAFIECYYLTSITIPETVTQIGESCFAYCIALNEVVIPENVLTVGVESFAVCMSLEKIVIKNSETTIGEYVAYTDITIADGCTTDEWVEKFYAIADAEKNGTADDSIYDDILSISITHDNPVAIPTVTIYGYNPSTAKTYAEENGIPFKNISELDSEQNENTTVKDTETNVEIEFDNSAFESEVELVVSEEAVNANIVFEDYENYKSYDISLEASGEKVQPNGKVTVKLPIPESFNAETTVVYYVAPNGTKTKLESRNENGYVIFETDHFSEYVLVDESTKHEHSYTGSITTAPTCTKPGVKTYTCSCNDSYTEPVPAKGHSHKAVTTAPTCTEKGYTTYTCSCGDSYKSNYINAKGHADNNGDYKCDNGCGYEYEKPAPDTPSDPSANCSCNCHKGGFMGLIWKIINFFQKLFKANPVCACGAAHY